MTDKPLLDVGDAQWAIINDILHKHIPDREVWAFGSRAKWTAKEFSDLDLVVIGQGPMSLDVAAALADDFSESDLPWKVDVVDWATTSEGFRKIIERDKVVVQKPSPSLSERNTSFDQPEFTLDELCLLVADCPHATPKWTDQGVVVLRNQNIKGGRLDLSEPSFTDEEHYLGRIRRAKPQAGDLVITREAPMGEVCLIPEGLKCCLGQRQVLLRPDPKKIESRYLLYALQSPYLQHQIGWNEGTGSTVSNLRIPVLEALKVPTPNLDVQGEVAATLGALDDRITLLRETNTTLEAIAQALFKSWFVDFDPVHAKMQGRAPEGMDQATAALFPDSFEDSELGPVPKGWGVGRLSDIASLKGGKMLGKASFVENGEHPVFGGAGVMGHSNLSNAEGFVITVGRVGAYCGQYFWHQGKAWVNNNASLVSPSNPDHSCWLFLWLKSVDMDLIKKGAAQPFVSNSDISELKIVLPPKQVIEKLVESVDPIFQKLSTVTTQIKSLESLRDTLLPRLISGQLRVNDAQETIQ